MKLNMKRKADREKLIEALREFCPSNVEFERNEISGMTFINMHHESGFSVTFEIEKGEKIMLSWYARHPVATQERLNDDFGDVNTCHRQKSTMFSFVNGDVNECGSVLWTLNRAFKKLDDGSAFVE